MSIRTRQTETSSNLVPTKHQSVLLHELINALNIKPNDIVLDATLGGAGHSLAISKILSSEGMLIGVDADGNAIHRAERLFLSAKARVHLVKGNFRNVLEILSNIEITNIDKAVFDFGWSADHIDSGRGFSFQKDEPLLMTYEENPSKDTLTARMIINEWSESSIVDILEGWGEERFARRIAKAIVRNRDEHPIESTVQLSEIITSVIPAKYRHGRIHPSTKTFQALRIAVNDEIGAAREGIKGAYSMLSSGGIIAVITFHSIEDRLIKRAFKSWEKDGLGTVVGKFISPSENEIKSNPCARSAKLRIFSKI